MKNSHSAPPSSLHISILLLNQEKINKIISLNVDDVTRNIRNFLIRRAVKNNHRYIYLESIQSYV